MTEIINIEKCDLKNFYYKHISKNKPCYIEGKKSPFSEKTEFVLGKSKLIDQGILELKKLIDLGNIKDIAQSFMKKELTGFINIIGTPKFSNSLSFDDMWMELVK